MVKFFNRLSRRNLPQELPVSSVIAWRALAIKAKESQLTNMRDLAAKWATSLALLTTVTAIGGLKVSPDALSQTSPFWHQVGLNILAAIIILFTIATIFAIWASQGHPVQTTDDPNEYAAFYSGVVNATVARLAVSMWLSFFCLVLILIFGGIVLFSPIDPSFHVWNSKPLTEPKAVDELKPYSVVRTSDGPVYCGTLEYQNNGTAVLITSEAESVKLLKVTDIQSASKCPALKMYQGVNEQLLTPK